MKYTVLNTFQVGKNTSVTIAGNGDSLWNGMQVQDELGQHHIIESVAMVEHDEQKKVAESTTLLISGFFDGKEIYC